MYITIQHRFEPGVLRCGYDPLWILELLGVMFNNALKEDKRQQNFKRILFNISSAGGGQTIRYKLT